MTTYTDINTAFLTQAQDDFIIAPDVENVKKSIERILTTSKGEVPFNRDFGSSLHSLLFENNLDPSDIAMFLYMDITTFEPRVTLNPADITIVQTDNNSFLVTCAFVVPLLNNTITSVSATLTRE